LSVLIGAAVALGLLLVQIGEVTVSDGADMFAVSQAILHHASFAVPAVYGAIGRGGHYYAKYGIGLSVAVLPLLAIADVVAIAVKHQSELESFAASSSIPIIMGLLTTTLWRSSRKLGAAPRWATVLAVGAAVGSYALPYGKDFLSEPLTALGIALAFNELLSDRYATGGFAIALAVVTRPEAAVLVGAIPLVVWMCRGFRNAVVCGLAAATGVVVDAAYNLDRFGNLFSSGYRGESFSTPFLHGAGGLLFGTNKSLILFAPIVILLVPACVWLWREKRYFVLLAITNFVVFFVLAALWHSWQGGWSWGPRLLLPGLLPAIPLLAGANRLQRRIATGLLVVGFVLSAATLVVPTEAQQFDHPLPLNGPSILRQYELVPTVVSYSVHHLTVNVHVAGASRRYLSLWQVNLGRELGAKGLLLGLVGTIMLLAALVFVMARARPLLAPPPIASRVETADGPKPVIH
jgi:hypothetical protein